MCEFLGRFYDAVKSRNEIWAGACDTRLRREIQTRFWWGRLKERDYMEVADVVGRIISTWVKIGWEGMNRSSVFQDTRTIVGIL